MLMVIMGAGASYDSAPTHPIPAGPGPHRPPLADSLFDGRSIFRKSLVRYSQAQPIIPYLAMRTVDSVETVLQGLSEEANTNFERPRQLLAIRYYIRDIIRECSQNWIKEISYITNHKTLLDQITAYEDERVLFVTFSYDELIEDAFSGFDFSPDTFDSYTRDPSRFALYKLHGSINWVRLVKRAPDNKIHRGEIIDSADIMNLRPNPHGFRIIQNPEQDVYEDWISIPALAIPINDKLDFECPPQHLEDLCESLHRVTKILTIGWKGRETQFTDLLRKNLKRVEKFKVVSVGDADEIASRLQTVLGSALAKAERTAHMGGFTSFVLHKTGIPLFQHRSLDE